MKTAVVTDSTAYIPKDLRDRYNIHMIPLNVIFGETSYREEIDMRLGQELLQRSKSPRKSPNDFPARLRRVDSSL